MGEIERALDKIAEALKPLLQPRPRALTPPSDAHQVYLSGQWHRRDGDIFLQTQISDGHPIDPAGHLPAPKRR